VVRWSLDDPSRKIPLAILLWRTSRSRFLNFPYRRLGWISQFKLDRGLAENADDSRLLAALLHSVIVRRVRDAANEATGGDRHSKFSPEFTHRVPEITKHSRSVT
jgi:hypothetical protein